MRWELAVRAAKLAGKLAGHSTTAICRVSRGSCRREDSSRIVLYGFEYLQAHWHWPASITEGIEGNTGQLSLNTINIDQFDRLRTTEEQSKSIQYLQHETIINKPPGPPPSTHQFLLYETRLILRRLDLRHSGSLGRRQR